ncbi:MAG: hypothetical protein Q7K65_02880 [Candidatus Buchananbacteria bacterium]|nr:hypothetical protein [Candidatus Buchananbacteria bacterium]
MILKPKSIALVVAVVVILIVGGVYVWQKSTLSDLKGAKELDNERAECELKGGKWINHGDLYPPKPVCNLPTADAGKKCTDSDQCESYCQAPKNSKIGVNTTGTCYEWKLAECMQEVKDGKAEATWCY